MLFKDYYQKAPEKIKESVDSSETAVALAEIAKKYGVGDEGLGNKDLGKLVGQVLVGMLHPKEFVPALVEELNIPKERAQEIAKEVNKKIFTPVKDLLIKLHRLEKTPQQNNLSAKKSLKENKEGVLKKEKPLVKKSEPAIPKPPEKKGGAVPTAPSIPKPPEKPVLDGNKIAAIPKPPQKESTGINIPTPPIPQKKSNTVVPSQKERNPFEEKLKQTFTIPKKTLIPTPPQTSAAQQKIELNEKKESIQKDPYLETVE